MSLSFTCGWDFRTLEVIFPCGNAESTETGFFFDRNYLESLVSFALFSVSKFVEFHECFLIEKDLETMSNRFEMSGNIEINCNEKPNCLYTFLSLKISFWILSEHRQQSSKACIWLQACKYYS